MTHEFTISGRLPGMNEIIGAARGHWAISSKQKKTSTATCADACKDVWGVKTPVRVTLAFFEKDARRDVDNIQAAAKFIMDGLVLAGVLQDDNQANVQSIHSIVAVDKVHPRIVVRLEEI